MLRKLHKAWALSWADWRLLVNISALLLKVRVLLKLFPFKVVMRRLSGTAGPQNEALSPDWAAYLLELASRYHVLTPTCLEKALVLCSILRTRGITAELTIGTRKENGQFHAHAWVEHQGQIIMGKPVEPYAELLTVVTGRSQRKLA